MGINWQQRDSVFRVLAAAYGELGEDVVSAILRLVYKPLVSNACCVQFRGHYRNIAKRFGPDATYDAIKNFFAREVTRAVQQYERQNAGKVPSLGASHGPTDFLLDDVEDDQDNLNEVSVLNDQQVAAFINGSDKSTTARRRLGLHQPPRDNPVQNGTLGARATALGSPPAPSCGQSAQKKRKYASVAPPAGEREPQPLIRNAPYVQPESFGFVTNQGEYRCALCMRKLVSQEALEQHEAMSKLHLRNLQNSMVVSTGRAKLVQATVVHQREDPSHLSPSPSAFLVSDQTAIAHEPRVPFPESSRYVGNGKSRARSISPPAPRKQQHGPAKEELYSEAPTPTVPGSNSGMISNNVEAPRVKH